MNYMKEVAQMLGVELGEEFKVSDTRDILGGRSKYNFVFTENGLIEKVGKSNFERNTSLVELLNGRCKVIKLPKPILDEAEKRYLSNVIKPFRSRVKYIVKRNENKNEYFEDIRVIFEDRYRSLYFPYFKKGTMYKGMELNKEYSVEDLGI